MSTKLLPVARFRLGSIVTTPNALSQLNQDDILGAIGRHQAGDWGDLCPHDLAANENALTNGARILSVYRTATGVKFWIITEADRTVTTILMPEDY